MCTALLEPRPGDTTDPNGTSPLHLAAKNGHIDIIRYDSVGVGSPAQGLCSWLGDKMGAVLELWPLDAPGTSSCPHEGCARRGWGVGIHSHIAWALWQSCHLLGDFVDTLNLSEPQLFHGHHSSTNGERRDNCWGGLAQGGHFHKCFVTVR